LETLLNGQTQEGEASEVKTIDDIVPCSTKNDKINNDDDDVSAENVQRKKGKMKMKKTTSAVAVGLGVRAAVAEVEEWYHGAKQEEAAANEAMKALVLARDMPAGLRKWVDGLKGLRPSTRGNAHVYTGKKKNKSTKSKAKKRVPKKKKKKKKLKDMPKKKNSNDEAEDTTDDASTDDDDDDDEEEEEATEARIKAPHAVPQQHQHQWRKEKDEQQRRRPKAGGGAGLCFGLHSRRSHGDGLLKSSSLDHNEAHLSMVRDLNAMAHAHMTSSSGKPFYFTSFQVSFTLRPTLFLLALVTLISLNV
jgi:hypothetical protein